MSVLTKCLLLFALNLLDALLTLIWIRGGWATEGNGLMARLLEAGDAPFLLVKLAVGALVSYTLFRFSHHTLARHGLTAVVSLYVGLMFVHAATAASALGSRTPEQFVAFVTTLPENLFALLS